MVKKKIRIVFFGYTIGVTITEILIIVVIIGVVSALALPMFVKTIEKAKVDEALSNLNLIRTGQKIYFLEYGFFAGDIDGDGDGREGIAELNIENPNDNTNAYFDYNITTTAGVMDDFTATANRKDDAPSPYRDHEYTVQKGGTVSGPLIQ